MPAASRFSVRVFGAQLAAIRRQDELFLCMGDSTGLDMLQHLDALGTERGRDGFGDGGVFAKEQCAAREDRDLAAQPGKGLRQFDCHHRRTDHGQPRGNGIARQRLGGGPVGSALQARNRRERGARTSGDETAVEGHRALTAFRQLHGQAVFIHETGLAMQHGDSRGALQDAFVLGMAQRIDAALLLGQQPLAQNGRRRGRQAGIERAFPAQMRNVRGADHDFGRHAADIDAGAADGAPLD